MLSEAEALQALLDHARLLAGSESVPLSDSNGRICAEDIIATIDIPGSDNSAMDGFACNSQSISLETPIAISQRVTAGSIPLPLKPGTAARIFTGASLPDGADCVVLQEDCRYDDQTVSFYSMPVCGQHVRYAGEDIRQGQIILRQGDVIGPAQVGVIAASGIDKVRVYQRLRIALLTTGDELLEPGASKQTGKLYNSNRYALTAAIRQLGFTVTQQRLVADTLAQTMHEFMHCANEADVVISTGGVSVGDEDHVKQALQNIGSMQFWKLAIKPGKPLAFGLIDDTPFIGLPGNPVSAMVTFLIIARPFLFQCQGIKNIQPRQYKVIANFEWQTKNRCEYLRVSLSEQDGRLYANLSSKQGSGIQSSLSESDGLVRIDKESTISPGDMLHYLPYNSLMNLPL